MWKMEKRKVKGLGKAWVNTFDCVSDIIRATDKKHMHPKAWKEAQSHLTYNNGMDWLGVADRPELERVVSKGWKDGLKRVRENLSVLKTPKLPNLRRRRVWAAQGDSLDIHKVYSGNLDQAWRKSVREIGFSGLPTTGTIIVDICANAGTTAEQLFWPGAAALALAETLEESGRPVRIIAYTAATNTYSDDNGYNHEFNEILIKDAGVYFDYEKLASVICLSGFFRHYIFKAYCLPAAHGVQVESGLGHAVNEKTHDWSYASGKCLVVSGVDDQKSAQKFLNEQLKVYDADAA